MQENSPGSKAGLQAFFDFVVAINGTRLDQDNDTLKQILKNGVGRHNICFKEENYLFGFFFFDFAVFLINFYLYYRQAITDDGLQ